MQGPFVLLILDLRIAELGFLALGLRALRRKRPLRCGANLTVALLFVSLSLLATTLAISTQGYRALTREDVALAITTREINPQLFEAPVEFPDGRVAPPSSPAMNLTSMLAS